MSSIKSPTFSIDGGTVISWPLSEIGHTDFREGTGYVTNEELSLKDYI